MKKEDIFEAIGNTDDALLERSEKRIRTNFRRIAIVATAACVLFVSIFAFVPLLRNNEEELAEQGGYTGHSEGSEYMIYQGPILPLSAVEKTALTAERSINYDFSPYIKHTVVDGEFSYEGRETACIVTDSYVIMNPTDGEITALFSYPFVSSYRELKKEAPNITIDGNPAVSQRFAGAYSGGFTGIYGSEDFENQTYNLDPASSWEDYAELLKNDSDLIGASEDILLPDDKITVYEFTDFSVPEDAESGATVAIKFNVDPSQSLYSYNMNGLSWDEQTGWVQYSVFCPNENRARPQESVLFAVAGGRIGEYTLQGYDNGSCEETVRNDSITAKVISYETTLEELLKKLIADLCGVQQWDDVPQRLLYHSSAELLLSHGALSDAPKDRYADSPDTRLSEIIQETFSMERVFYDTFSVTVQAGGSVNISAKLRKNGSFDYEPADENSGIYGYDLLTAVGSNLILTNADASIEDHGMIEIVRQNYGFDLKNGVRKVSLDLCIPRYYLEVRQRSK